MTTEYIETRMVPLAQLQPYPGNSRRGDRARLLESLEANGQYRSLVVRRTDDGEMIVLAGNNTMAALEHRGDESARCEIVACDDATALRVNLVDNASNDRATYDEEARARLIAELDGAVSGSGYTEEEADALLARYEEPEILHVEETTAEYNDSAEEREARQRSHGGDDSKTYESRGVRDIFLALPSDQADELGRLIMALREPWGTLSQGEVLLRAARVAADVAVQDAGGADSAGRYMRSAEVVYAPESAGEPTDG